MTPEKRRELYGLLTTAYDSLRAVYRACPDGPPNALALEVLAAKKAVGFQVQRLEQEIDDAS